MTRVGFEPTIPVFKWAKTVHAATVIGSVLIQPLKFWNENNVSYIQAEKQSNGTIRSGLSISVPRFIRSDKLLPEMRTYFILRQYIFRLLELTVN
jgi:hypothetical protein